MTFLIGKDVTFLINKDVTLIGEDATFLIDDASSYLCFFWLRELVSMIPKSLPLKNIFILIFLSLVIGKVKSNSIKRDNNEKIWNKGMVIYRCMKIIIIELNYYRLRFYCLL